MTQESHVYIDLIRNAHTGASQVASVVKNLPASVVDTRDTGSISGSGRYPAVGSGNPL